MIGPHFESDARLAVTDMADVGADERAVAEMLGRGLGAISRANASSTCFVKMNGAV